MVEILDQVQEKEADSREQICKSELEKDELLKLVSSLLKNKVEDLKIRSEDEFEPSNLHEQTRYSLESMRTVRKNLEDCVEELVKENEGLKMTYKVLKGQVNALGEVYVDLEKQLWG